MTNYELNQAIHAWMGRGEWSPLVDPFDETSGKDYCNDHDAVREFLRMIADADVNDELFNKFDAEMKRTHSIMIGSPLAFTLNVSPRQLAEVGAKAVGIWSETKTDTDTTER